MNIFLPGASVGLCWSPLVYASNAPSSAWEHQNCMCVCVCVCVFQLWSPPPPQLQERTFRIISRVQTELSPSVCLSDQGLKNWSDQQPDLEVWLSLRGFQLTQACQKILTTLDYGSLSTQGGSLHQTKASVTVLVICVCFWICFSDESHDKTSDYDDAIFKSNELWFGGEKLFACRISTQLGDQEKTR